MNTKHEAIEQHSHGADVYQIMEKYQSQNIIDFSSNVNIFSPKGISTILTEINESELAKYPDINYYDLRNNIGEKYNLNKENIIVGNGSTELIFLVMKLERIKRVGIVGPTFGEYERAAKIEGKEIFMIPYEKDFSINLNAFTENLDIIFVCNPNNPSGNSNYLTPLLERCKKQGTLLFVDETFMDFTAKKENSLLTYVPEYDNLIVLKAVTKFYALTGVRLGYAFANSNIIQKLWDIKEPWTINYFAQRLFEVVFDFEFEKKSTDFYEQEIRWMKEKLDKIPGITAYPTESNFFLIKLENRITSGELKENLVKNHGILIRDCANFWGLDNLFIRVNIKERTLNEQLLKALAKEIQR